MIEPELQFSTHNSRIDHILKAIIRLGELLFGGRIRGYYLQGSYASGDATPTSDIDLNLLFKGDFLDEEESKRAWQIDTLCEWLTGRQLDIIPITEEMLSTTRVEDAALIMHLKYGSRLLYGEEIRTQIHEPSRADYIRSCMYAAFRAVSWHHHHPRPLPFPLSYPDPAGEFYGFNQSMHSVDGEGINGTERLVYSVVRIAGALVALETEHFAFTKRECVSAYASLAVDGWSNWVAEVFHCCHERWQYRIPDEVEERVKLKYFCQHVLDFENHFLDRYIKLLRQDVTADDPRFRQFAEEKLLEICNSI